VVTASFVGGENGGGLMRQEEVRLLRDVWQVLSLLAFY
jgi:hypothetical protein